MVRLGSVAPTRRSSMVDRMSLVLWLAATRSRVCVDSVSWPFESAATRETTSLENVVERCEPVLESVQHTVVSIASRECRRSTTRPDTCFFYFVGIEAWSMRLEMYGQDESFILQIRGSKAVKNCYHPIPATVQVRVGKMSAARQTGQHY